jgi:hypothetical protein
MIKFIVILILLVVVVGAAYYFFNKREPEESKYSKKPTKFQLYDDPNCTGEMITAIELGSKFDLDAKIEIKPDEGKRKACCMKLENLRINDGFAKNEAGKEIFEPKDSMKNIATDQIELEGCSNDYMFSISPLE